MNTDNIIVSEARHKRRNTICTYMKYLEVGGSKWWLLGAERRGDGASVFLRDRISFGMMKKFWIVDGQW